MFQQLRVSDLKFSAVFVIPPKELIATVATEGYLDVLARLLGEQVDVQGGGIRKRFV